WRVDERTTICIIVEVMSEVLGRIVEGANLDPFNYTHQFSYLLIEWAIKMLCIRTAPVSSCQDLSIRAMVGRSSAGTVVIGGRTNALHRPNCSMASLTTETLSSSLFRARRSSKGRILSHKTKAC